MANNSLLAVWASPINQGNTITDGGGNGGKNRRTSELKKIYDQLTSLSQIENLAQSNPPPMPISTYGRSGSTFTPLGSEIEGMTDESGRGMFSTTPSQDLQSQNSRQLDWKNDSPYSDNQHEMALKAVDEMTKKLATDQNNGGPRKVMQSGVAKTDDPLRNPSYSNYNTAYNSPGSIESFLQPPASSQYGKSKKGTEGFSTDADSALNEKLGKILFLLEQQKKQRTENVMEDFVLYSLLGVFMVYSLDSFVRIGKYVR